MLITKLAKQAALKQNFAPCMQLLGSQRSFSRADIMKSLDKSKVSRRTFIQKELTENPEFFKAFPHLQAIFSINENGEIQEDTQYQHDKQVSFKDPTEEQPYFETLLHHHNKYMAPKEAEEQIRENEKNFIESYESPQGPNKWYSSQQIQAIHSEVDARMQELEDSGLTREEILYDQQKGIPLSDDPFFQFIKNNKTAREMLVKPGEVFNADRVIEKALRQDVGPDTSLAMNKHRYKYDNEDSSLFPTWEYKKKYRDRDPVLNAESYLYDYQMIERRTRQFDFDQEKPATFINRPLSRSQLRKKFMRQIKKKDINWRDTALLAKFLNETGKLMNKFQTRLPTVVQRKVAKTVKKVRAMALFPHVGLLKPTDKIPLGSFIEDMEEMHKKTIDPVTGRMFLKHSLQDELPKKEKRQKEKLEERFEGVESQKEYEQEDSNALKEAIIREMSLDNEKLMPDSTQRHWMAAQAHIVDRDNLLDELKKSAEVQGEKYTKPDTAFLGANEAYDEAINKLKNKEPEPNGLFEDFISERALDIYQFHQETPKRFESSHVEDLRQKSKEKAVKGEEETASEVRRNIQKIMEEYTSTSNKREPYHEFEKDKYWSKQRQEKIEQEQVNL